MNECQVFVVEDGRGSVRIVPKGVWCVIRWPL